MIAVSAQTFTPPPESCEKLACLRQHLACFEGRLIGNKAAKSEGKKMNNSGTLLRHTALGNEHTNEV